MKSSAINSAEVAVQITALYAKPQSSSAIGQRSAQALVPQLRAEVVCQPDKQKDYRQPKYAELNERDGVIELKAEIGGERVETGRNDDLGLRRQGSQ